MNVKHNNAFLISLNFFSINLCCQAARTINAFLVKKTELNGMTAYQERTDLLNKVIANFVDKLYYHIVALFENMVNFF